jgi:L,D-peptidoglycan transpeptidase YkuD (ErfK/YbiS/YcfS/YnhG family)
MGWCNDPKSKLYNKEIKINKLVKHEKLFRKDNMYDYFMIINYNQTKTISFKGSAIFLHLTKTYKPTTGCIAVKKNDFLVLAKLIKKEIKIDIS